MLPKDTYDVDETGFVMGNSQSRRVIEIIRHPRDQSGRLFPADLVELQLPPGTRIQDGSREFATVICCICADGSFLNSAIIMKAKHGLQDSWFRDIAGVPESILFGVSPNGWTDRSKCLAWLKHNFGPNSKSRTKAGARWQMLLFDGHSSHVNKEFLLQCLDYRVLPVCLPPHTTHFSQPLDVAVFSPLKKAYSDILQERYQQGEKGVWKGNFYQLLDYAQRVAFTAENIQSGFMSTGLVPTDFEIIRRKFNFPQPKHSTPSEDGRQSSASDLTPILDLSGSGLSQPNLDSQPQCLPIVTPSPQSSLHSLTASQIFEISTPRNPQTLHHLHHSLSEEFSNSNSPRSWCARHIIEKISNAGMSALHERDYLQSRLEVVAQQQQNREQSTGRRRRHLIPDEGLVFHSRQDIQTYFEEREIVMREKWQAKIIRARERAAKVQIRIEDLAKKKKKHGDLQERGKLPLGWRSAVRLGED